MSGNEMIIFTIGAICVFALFIIITERARKKEILRRIRSQWGQVPDREYTSEELQAIGGYYRSHSKGREVVDDITWNDLDMDRIFMLLNRTYSYAGEDYLYHLLRTPATDNETLAERDRLIHFFEKHQAEREQLQTLCYMTGKPKNISVSDCIYRLNECEEKSSLPHYLSAAGLLGSIVLALFMPLAGIILALGFIVFNLMRYFKYKEEVASFLSSIIHVVKVLSAADDMKKIEHPELRMYTEEILGAKKKFKKFMKHSYLVTTTGAAGGSIEAIVLDYVRMLFHVDLIKFRTMVRELKSHIDDLEIIIADMGLLESMTAVASYRSIYEMYCKPELTQDKKAYLRASNLYHPLIDEPVANSIVAESNVLITGSNASGKSTFLKTTALNSILAQTIYTCMATSYQAAFFQIYSSMALRDDLIAKDSYFMVEIKSLKRILNHADDELPVLCFVDEVLRGTNTVERIAASAQILKSLAKDNILCFAATHDIELTYLLEECYDNYHFVEEMKENDILFNYQIYEGRAVSRNAIKLLSIIGYDDSIIEKAEETAAVFLEQGTWTL